MHVGEDLLTTGDDIRHVSGSLASTVCTPGMPTRDPSLGDLVGSPDHAS